ncbi:MAG: asparagine synthase-related protein [Thermoanaerobaculia bacterium]
MSAFVCVLDRSGAPIEPGELRRLAEPLAAYGPELATLCRGPVGIAVLHGGGPGARERHGPLADEGTGRVVAVAGRLRAPGVLAGDPGGSGDATGAVWALAAWRAGRSHPPSPGGPPPSPFLAAATGAFTLVTADPAAPWIRIARDHLGALKVYYFLDRRWLIAASEPTAILCHPAVPSEPDEVSAVRFLGFRFGPGERSFFRDVRELPPAHWIEVTPAEARTGRYWRFPGACAAAEGSEDEVAGELLLRLERSVEEETGDLEPGRVALSLSGGLDSTAVAALAPRGVQAFSWTFDEVPDGDEREAVDAVCRYLDLPVRRVPGDGAYPLTGDFAERFVHGSSPYVNAFAALKARLYAEARAAGCRRVLVGDAGDALYAAQEYWLRDVLVHRRPGALGSMAATLRRASGGDPFARLALVRLLPVRGLRSAVLRHPAPWLTRRARGILPPSRPAPIVPPGRRRVRHDLIAGAKPVEIASEERRLFALCGVERADPFWSWPVLELAIHLPADWSYRDGRTKVLSRTALRGRLPDRVVDGRRSGLLGAFFLRGLELARDDLRETVFRRPHSDWPRHVRREWLEPYLDSTGSIAFGHTILWRVISYELWTRRLIRGA